MYNNDFPHHFPKNFSGEELPQQTRLKAPGTLMEKNFLMLNALKAHNQVPVIAQH